MKKFIIVMFCIATMLLGVSCVHAPDIDESDATIKDDLKGIVIGNTLEDVKEIDHDAKPELFGATQLVGGNPQILLEDGKVQPARALLYVSYHSTDDGVVRFIYEFYYNGSMQKSEEDKEYYENGSELKICSIKWGADPNEDTSVLFKELEATGSDS
ncbi:MAG: hypothetical protein IKK58_05665 [Clostridia bacterium]|nr:hypothetical protein [Clostridia bacterium]